MSDFVPHRRSLIIWLSAAPLLCASAASAIADSPVQDALSAAAEALARAKASAEDRVRLLRGRFSDGAISEGDLREAERYYAEARADMNDGIEILLAALLGGGAQRDTPSSAETARRAGEGAARFIRFADGLLFGEDRGPGGDGELGTELGKGVDRALLDIAKGLPAESEPRNRLLDQRLEALRWTQFGDIH
jgi:hypothetical protein